MNGPIKLAIILTLFAMLFTLVDAKAMSTGEGTYTVSAILVCMCVYRGGGGGGVCGALDTNHGDDAQTEGWPNISSLPSHLKLFHEEILDP